MQKILPFSLNGFVRLYAVALLVLIGWYVGWWRLAPVPVIVVAAGLNTLLSFRWQIDLSWLRSLRWALAAFLTAEIFCLIGIYFFGGEIFLLAHDVLHVVSLYFCFQVLFRFFDLTRAMQNCSLRCCSASAGWNSPGCNLRNLLAALLASSVMLACVPMLLWWWHQSHPFLGLPESMTELNRTVGLVVFPAIAWGLLLLGFIFIEFRKQNLNQRLLPLILLGLALLSYSFFQLFIYLLLPAVAIPVEEFLEFFPMVPIFYFLLGKQSTFVVDLAK